MATNAGTTRGTHEREANDFYATDPRAVSGLMAHMAISLDTLEPCAGAGHIAKALERYGIHVTMRDLVKRTDGVEICDFLKDERCWDGDIVTNPPYSLALEFARHAIDVVRPGSTVAFFLPIRWLASKGRQNFFANNPPRKVLVFCSRVGCAKNGDFGAQSGNAVDYAWYVWEKGYKGRPEIEWIPESELEGGSEFNIRQIGTF